MNIEQGNGYLGGQFFAVHVEGRRVAFCGWFYDEDGNGKQQGHPLVMEFLKAAFARGAEVHAMDAAPGRGDQLEE
jgi:hypothetical protein